MRLNELAKLACVKEARLWEPDYPLQAVHCDSRRITSGVAFAAIRGLRDDGHKFIEQARKAGAPVLMVSEATAFEKIAQADPEHLAGVLLIEAGRMPLAELSAAIWNNPSSKLCLLGVTGTNGKTTVSMLAAQLLRGLGRGAGIIGTLGMGLPGALAKAERTTPEAPDIQAFLAACLEQDVSHAVMEVSSIAIALERTSGLAFHAAAFTNLSQDHLDFHGDLAAYEAQKARLFLDYGPGRAVLNLDDAAGRRLAVRLAKEAPETPLCTYSLRHEASLGITALTETVQETRGILVHGKQSAPFTLRLPGRFNLSNLLAAVGLVMSCGVSLGAIAPLVETLKGAPGRFEQVPLKRDFAVVVDYAHTPDALANTLREARKLTRGRLWVVIGCGGNRDKAKRPLMARIAESQADQAIFTSDNPRYENPLEILKDMLSGLDHPEQAQVVENRAEAIQTVLALAASGDLVLVAGKGHETTQEIQGKILPFDDREVVKSWSARNP